MRTPDSAAPSPTLDFHRRSTLTVGTNFLSSGVGGSTFSFLNEWQPARTTSDEVNAIAQKRFMHPASRPLPDHRALFEPHRVAVRCRPSRRSPPDRPCVRR